MTGTKLFRSIMFASALAACSSPAGPQFDPPDAAPKSTCGNNVCEQSETLESCPADCSICGDNECTGNETVSSCPKDCGKCGDGVCSSNESVSSCPMDCGADLLLQNDTGNTMTAFYFEPCGQGWTDNVLYPYTIGPYSTFEFTGVPPGCYYWEATAGSEVWETPSGITLTAAQTFTWTMY